MKLGPRLTIGDVTNLVVALAAIVAVVYLVQVNRVQASRIAELSTSSGNSTSVAVGEQLPALTLNGDSTASLFGDSDYTVVAILTAECPYSERSLDDWSELESRLDARILMRGLSLSSPDDTARYIETHAIGWSVATLRAGSDALRPLSVPQTLVVDRTGRVRAVWVGELNSDRVDEILGALMTIRSGD